jgi:hypothetical protein
MKYSDKLVAFTTRNNFYRGLSRPENISLVHKAGSIPNAIYQVVRLC